VALAVTPGRQSVRWIVPTAPSSVTLSVDDQEREFKAAFAGTLLALRVGAGIRSQKALALDPDKLARGVSEATVRRWEDPELPGLPDAYQVGRLCEILGCEPAELIRPQPLTARERQIARRAGRALGRGRRDGREHAG
jgi:hypothetical protein